MNDKMKFKFKNQKIFAVLLSLIMLFNSFFGALATETEEYEKNIAEVKIIGGKIVKNNIRELRGSPNENITLSKVGGEDVIQLVGSGQTQYLAFDIDDTFAHNVKDGTTYLLEIDYIDNAYSTIDVYYDAVYDEKCRVQAIPTKKTNMKETAVFELNDAYFGGRYILSNVGWDFVITPRLPGGSQNRTLNITGVRIKKSMAKKPVVITKITTDETGNIFGNSDEQKVCTKLENLTKTPKDVTVKYTVRETGGKVVYSKEEKTTVGADTSIDFITNLDIKTYGLFDLIVEAVADGKSHKSVIPCSLVNTIEDGRKNGKFGWCIGRTTDERTVDAQAELMKKSGASFIRTGIDWNNYEVEKKGSYNVPAEKALHFELAKKSGLGVLPSFRGGNVMYDGVGQWAVPDTEEKISGFLNFARFAIEDIESRGAELVGYEIWNEPNLVKFNTNDTPGDKLGYFYHRLAEVIREYDTKSPVYHSSHTSLDSERSKTMFEAAMKENLDCLADGIALHTYSHNVIPEIGLRKEVAEYFTRFKEMSGQKAKGLCSELGYMYITTNTVRAKSYLEAAKFNTRLYILSIVDNHFTQLAWYCMIDPGLNMADSELSFGATQFELPAEESTYYMDNDYAYAAKEWYVACVNMNNLLSNAECERKITDTDNKYAYIFRRADDGKTVMPVWTSGEAVNLAFKCSAESLTLYDLYGNAETVYGKDGVYSVTLSDGVQYFEGYLDDVELCKTTVTPSYSNINIGQGTTAELKFECENPEGLTAELEVTAEEIEVIKSLADLEKGEHLEIKANGEIGFSTDILLRIKDDGKTAFVYRIPVSITEVVSWRIESEIAEDGEKFGINLQLSNNDLSKPVTGTLAITAPSEISGKYKKLDFGTIPAGQKGIIRLEPQPIDRLGMYTTDYSIRLDNGFSASARSNLDFSLAKYAHSKPKIDGVLGSEEWDYSSKLYSENESQVKFNVSNVWGGVDDVSARAMVMYDDENFYLAVDVTDDVEVYNPVKDSNSWRYDSIQFGVTTEARFHDTQIGGSFTEITMSKTAEGDCVTRYMSENNEKPSGLVERAEVAVTREGNHTFYELCLPWDEITIKELDFNTIQKIGFSMLVNDNDGSGRKGYIEYASGIGSAKDSSLFSFLNLVK